MTARTDADFAEKLHFLCRITRKEIDHLVTTTDRLFPKAGKFGWLDSADEWMTFRKLRNQMVHEYIEYRALLADALNAGAAFVPLFGTNWPKAGERGRRPPVAGAT